MSLSSLYSACLPKMGTYQLAFCINEYWGLEDDRLLAFFSTEEVKPTFEESILMTKYLGHIPWTKLMPIFLLRLYSKMYQNYKMK